MSDRLIVHPGNLCFLLMLALSVLGVVVIHRTVGEKDERTKRNFVAGLYLLSLVLFAVYKFAISLDPDYYELAGYGSFTWWNELPLNGCNIVLLLAPVAVLTMKTPLLAYVYYTSLLGPTLALLMPGLGFDGYSLLVPRVAGYYVTHFIALMAGPILHTLGLYRPKLKDIPAMYAMLLSIITVIFFINIAMRATGINLAANYFFTIDPEGNFLLELFRSWIPVPFFYVIPAFLAVIPIFALIGMLGGLLEKYYNKK